MHFIQTRLLMCSALLAPLCAGAAPVDAKISRVENGLLPAQVVKGSRIRTTSLADEMRRLHVPGVSVAVIRKGSIAWAKGYGVTDRNGPSVTTDTQFQTASISKSITAMAALQMVQTGMLELDRPVNDYLTS